MELLFTFIALSIVNVIFSTVRTLVTVNGGKGTASLLSGGYFAFYNIMLIYTVADFPMWQKCVITFICNVVGVFVVKWVEEKSRKDKMWKVELTANPKVTQKLIIDLKEHGIPFNYIPIEKYTIFNLYCATQKESAYAKEICEKYGVKYFVSETKAL